MRDSQPRDARQKPSAVRDLNRPQQIRLGVSHRSFRLKSSHRPPPGGNAPTGR